MDNRSCYTASDVNKTFFLKTKINTKTTGLNTKTKTKTTGLNTKTKTKTTGLNTKTNIIVSLRRLETKTKTRGQHHCILPCRLQM